MDTAIGDNGYRYINGGQAAIYYTSEAYTKLENEIAKLKKKNKELKKKLKGHRYCEMVRDNAYAPRHTGFKIENLGTITGSGGDGGGNGCEHAWGSIGVIKGVARVKCFNCGAEKDSGAMGVMPDYYEGEK